MGYAVFGFRNLGGRLRNRKDAEKWFKGWSRCCAVRNLNSSVWFVRNLNSSGLFIAEEVAR